MRRILPGATVGVLACAAALCLPSGAGAAFPGLNGKISFTSDRFGSHDLFALSNPTAADGSASLARLTFDPGNDAQSAWSPDGSRVAFRSRRNDNYDTFVINADGSGETRLTNGAPAFSTQPSWSPDGRNLLFRSNRDGDYELFSMNADGSNVLQLTNNAVLDSAPAWSPDGARIAFRSERDGQSEIYVMAVDGSGQARITFDPAHDEGPAWSPDGSRMVFTTERTGNGEIYVMAANGSNPVNVSNAISRELSPDWQPVPARGGPPVYPLSTRDGAGPRLRVSARLARRALRERAVVLKVTCDEPCSLSASGRLRVGKRRALALRRAKRSAAAATTVRLRLRISKRALGAARMALRKGRGVSVVVRVDARDSSGNGSSAARTARVRR